MRYLLRGVSAVVVCVMVVFVLSRATGQIADLFRNPFGAKAEPEPRPQNSIVLSEDRDKARSLAQAVERLKLKRYGEVARHLGKLLEDPNTADFFLQPDAGQSRRSFKYELRRLLGALPPEGREAYELQFGTKAKQLLETAIDEGNTVGLQEVARRYPHTQAGYEAAFLLGRMMLDEGRPDEAFQWLEQLRETSESAGRFEPMLSLLQAMAAHRAGQSKIARDTLLALKKRDPDAAFTLAGQEHRLFGDEAQVLAWLTEVAGPARESRPETAIAQSVPQMRSRSPEIAVTEEREQVNREIESVRARNETPLPVLHPVVVGNYVLMRTPAGVQASSLATGKVQWQYSSDGGGSAGTTIDQLIWREAAFGRISSDGGSAFVVEGAYAVPSTLTSTNMHMMLRRGPFFGGPAVWGGGSGTPLPPDSYNKLTAIDVAAEGKLRWSVGGAEDQREPRLSGAFFLGPPAVEGQRLYVLAEIKSQIHLAVLAKQNGRLVWLQKLADVETAIHVDPFRRMAGASPVVASGIVICPTSYGGVVAVDVTRRSLLWAYQHERKDETMLRRNQGRLPSMAQGGRWADASLLVADGRVVLTPLESDEIHCLDLRTGRRLWKQPRGASLYAACIHNDNVILVDARFVAAKKLSNGTSAWKSVELPDQRRPSGRGVQSGDSYYLPLTDAAGGYEGGGQIVQIDLKAGKITDRVASQRDFVPGNLIFHDGVFISQGVQYLETFEQLAVLEKRLNARLKREPSDAQAWARLADLKRSTGKLPEAIEHLRKAHSMSPTAAIRNAYAAILLDGITAKLPNQAELAEELGRLAR